MKTPADDAPPKFVLGQRPSLDGVRGLAILLVLLCHIPSLPLQGGFIGVDLFFVLSGFLITTLLLEEWEKTKTIRLKDFYVRRALRLLPALLLVLGTVVIFSAQRETSEAAAAMQRSALLTLFYAANWFLAFGAYPRGELGPTWSLSVEEQFYVVWPVLLLSMLRLGWSRRTIGGVLLAGLLASAATRAALWGLGRSPDRIFFGTDTHADGLLAGALTGLLLSGRPLPKGKLLDWSAHLTLGLLGLLVFLGWQSDPALVLGGYLALNLGGATLVACLAASPSAGLRRVFEFGPLVWLGRLSYGIYLWHIAVFWMLSQLGWPGGRGHWMGAIGLTLAVAAASFYGVERPVLRQKRRFGRPLSP